MKKIILLMLLTLSTSIIAQKEMKEGVITMKMNMSTDNEQAQAAMAMMGDMEITSYIKGKKVRTEQNSQMTGSQISIVDNAAKKMVMFMDNPYMGKKYMEQSIEKSPDELKDVTVTSNGKTKTVLGYTCKGYNISTTQQGQKINMVMYVTDKISVQEQYTAMLGGKLKGFPMHIVVSANQGGMNVDITMEVIKMNAESVADSKFDMTIPDGYEKLPGM